MVAKTLVLPCDNFRYAFHMASYVWGWVGVHVPPLPKTSSSTWLPTLPRPSCMCLQHWRPKKGNLFSSFGVSGFSTPSFHSPSGLHPDPEKWPHIPGNPTPETGGAGRVHGSHVTAPRAPGAETRGTGEPRAPRGLCILKHTHEKGACFASDTYRFDHHK